MRTPIVVFLVFTSAFLFIMNGVAQDSESLYEETIRVTAPANVNVRDEASTRDPAIATLRAGEIVIVLEQIPEGESVSGNMLWYRIALNDGSEGFIWSGAVRDLQIDRTCVGFIAADPANIWLALRERAMPLLAWDADRQRLVAQGNTGSERLLWATMASKEEVSGLTGISETLNVSPILDSENCQEVGALVDNNGFPHYAIKETPNNPEIKFINANYVIEIRRATPEEYQNIELALIAHTTASDAVSAANTARRELLIGERIAFVGILPGTRNSGYLRQRIYLVSLDNSNVMRLTDNPDGAYYESNPRWSPDYSRVAYTYSNAYSMIRSVFYSMIEDRQQRVEAPYLPIIGSWSPDGALVAILRPAYAADDAMGIVYLDTIQINYNSIIFFSIDDVPDSPRGPKDFGAPLFSPTGELLTFYVLEDSQEGVYTLDINTQVINRLGAGLPLSWSPDGRRLLSLYSSDSYRTMTFNILDISTHESIPLTSQPIPYTYAAYPVWSPDGRQIALPYQEEDHPYASLYVVDEATWNWRQLTTDLIVRGVAWSPDGEQLVFVGRQPTAMDEYEALYVINADGTNQRLLVDGIDYYSDLVWLPAIDN